MVKSLGSWLIFERKNKLDPSIRGQCWRVEKNPSVESLIFLLTKLNERHILEGMRGFLVNIKKENFYIIVLLDINTIAWIGTMALIGWKIWWGFFYGLDGDIQPNKKPLWGWKLKSHLKLIYVSPCFYLFMTCYIQENVAIVNMWPFGMMEVNSIFLLFIELSGNSNF